MNKDWFDDFFDKNLDDDFLTEDYTSESDIIKLSKSFLMIEGMTQKKLQKLCYYAKAWYLALYDENLIKESFEAWVHGAVQPELYQYFRAYGFQPIPQYKEADGEIPESFKSFAQEIYDVYGDLSGDELERLNHTEDPWKKARKGLDPWVGSNNVIDENDMKQFYRELMKNG